MRLKWSLLAHFFFAYSRFVPGHHEIQNGARKQRRGKKFSEMIARLMDHSNQRNHIGKECREKKTMKKRTIGAHLIVLPLILRLLLKCASFQINFYCTTLFSTATIFVLSWKMWVEREKERENILSKCFLWWFSLPKKMFVINFPLAILIKHFT